VYTFETACGRHLSARAVALRAALFATAPFGVCARDAEEPVKQLSKLLAGLISVALQNNWNRGIGRVGDGRRYMLKLQSALGGSLLLTVLLCAGCVGTTLTPAAGNGGASARVTGTVSYRERLALLPDVVIRVQLADVSRADAPAILIGEVIIKTDGNQVPFRFEIPYDAAAIKPQHTYAVSARIEGADGRLQFVVDQRYSVITRGAPTHADLVLRQTGGR
jgi:putative lipoprotein